MAERLTLKEEKYVQGVAIKGLSQREAFKAAYDCKNMKDETIDKRASELLKKGKVRGRYDELMAKVIGRSEEKALLTAEKTFARIAELAYMPLDHPLVQEGIVKVSDINKATEQAGKILKVFTDKVKLDITPIVIGGEDELED